MGYTSSNVSSGGVLAALHGNHEKDTSYEVISIYSLCRSEGGRCGDGIWEET